MAAIATPVYSPDVREMIPPDELNFVGTGNFESVGREFFKYFVELVGLQPYERVLDVGCGIGRIALPLTQYLNRNGRYDGFDVVPLGIEWCQKKITPRYSNFRFQLADIHNEHYAPQSPVRACCYRFPYRARSFDFVFLTSVFTHMLPADLENYVYEIARVLKRDGRCLATFFLLNQESRELMARGQGTLSFPHPLPSSPCQVLDPVTPERAVAYEEEYVLRTLAKYGLQPTQPVRYGHWCGRNSYLSYQDVVIFSKTRNLSLAECVGRIWKRTQARCVQRGRMR